MEWEGKVGLLRSALRIYRLLRLKSFNYQKNSKKQKKNQQIVFNGLSLQENMEP